jgi:hypothetical protein
MRVPARAPLANVVGGFVGPGEDAAARGSPGVAIIGDALVRFFRPRTTSA